MLDIRKIAADNNKTAFGKTFCFVKSNNSQKKRLLIVLSAHNQYNKYFLFRSFLENQKYDMLFLTDNNTWYLDDNFGKNYEEVIREYIKNYDKKDVVIFGSSMGGYGAAWMAAKLGVHCLLCNPQIDLPISMDWGWVELREHLRGIVENHKYINVIRLLEENVDNNVFFVIYGHNPIDEINVNLLLTSCQRNKKIIAFQFDGDDHNFPFDRNVELIYKCLDLIFLSAEIKIDNNIVLPFILENRIKRRENKFYAPFEANPDYVGKEHHLWVTRNQINKSGLFNFVDIGTWRDGCYSGVLMFRDNFGNFHCISPLNENEDLANISKKGYLENNEKINENVWIRILDGTRVFCENKSFIIEKIENKNMYLNAEVSHPSTQHIASNKSNIIPITAVLDIKINAGNITFSVIYINKEGKYISDNRKIKESGVYTINTLCYDVDFRKHYPISLRIYPCLDGINKTISINKLFSCVGTLPQECFE